MEKVEDEQWRKWRKKIEGESLGSGEREMKEAQKERWRKREGERSGGEMKEVKRDRWRKWRKRDGGRGENKGN